MGLAGEDSLFSFPKSLSVWWSEETEYVLQRIERWAAYARGYNRLRSARLSPGRMTMREDGGYGRAERARLRGCCGAGGGGLGPLGYKSNGRLESSCLEAYSLDHSIYFKTVGEIRSERGQLDANENSAIEDGGNSNNNNNNNNNWSSRNNNSYGNGGVGSCGAKSPPPLDCGDFLSSDFDEEELPELDQQLREQLDQLEAARVVVGGGGSEVVQLCRSVMSEDEINNNLRLAAGIPRRLPAAAQ